jgi:hypothetical protein
MLSLLSSLRCRLLYRRHLLFVGMLVAAIAMPWAAAAQMTAADAAKLRQALAAYDRLEYCSH